MMKYKFELIFFTSLIIIILVLLLNMDPVRGANLPLQSTPAGMLTVQLQMVQSSLQEAKDPQEKIALQEKMEAQQFALNVQMEAQMRPTVTLKEICANRVPVPQYKAMVEGGIFEVRDDFLVSQGIKINNMFQGEMDGTLVEVYAGSSLDDPNQGLVILAIDALGVWLRVFDPSATGSLQIIEANGSRLSLQTITGNTRLYFDIPARQFVDSVDAVVPPMDLPVAKDLFLDPCQGK